MNLYPIFLSKNQSCVKKILKKKVYFKILLYQFCFFLKYKIDFRQKNDTNSFQCVWKKLQVKCNFKKRFTTVMAHNTSTNETSPGNHNADAKLEYERVISRLTQIH